MHLIIYMHISYVCVQIYIIECTHRHGNFHEANIAERFRLVRCRMVAHGVAVLHGEFTTPRPRPRSLGFGHFGLGNNQVWLKGCPFKKESENQRIRMNQNESDEVTEVTQ